MALNFDDEKCDLLILKISNVIMLPRITEELSNFCKKYSTLPLFVHDFDTHINFNEDKSIPELQDIENFRRKLTTNHKININGCVGFKVATYGEACKVYQNINELSIFNKLDSKIRTHDDVKHFRLSDKKEVMYVKLYYI